MEDKVVEIIKSDMNISFVMDLFHALKDSSTTDPGINDEIKYWTKFFLEQII